MTLGVSCPWRPKWYAQPCSKSLSSFVPRESPGNEPGQHHVQPRPQGLLEYFQNDGSSLWKAEKIPGKRLRHDLCSDHSRWRWNHTHWNYRSLMTKITAICVKTLTTWLVKILLEQGSSPVAFRQRNFKNRRFSSTVWPTVHTNLSWKRSFWTRSVNQQNLKTSTFRFIWFWRFVSFTFENDDVTKITWFFCSSFPASNSNPKGLVHDDCYFLKFLRRSVDGKHLMAFTEWIKTSVLEFPRHSVDRASVNCKTGAKCYYSSDNVVHQMKSWHSFSVQRSSKQLQCSTPYQLNIAFTGRQSDNTGKKNVSLSCYCC